MNSTVGKVLSAVAVLFMVVAVTFAVWPSGDTAGTAATSAADNTPTPSTAAESDVPSTSSVPESTATAVAPETTDNVVDNGHIVGTGTVQASNADVVPLPIDASVQGRDKLLTQLSELLTQYYTVLPADDTNAWRSRVAPLVSDQNVLNDFNFAVSALAPAAAIKRQQNQTTSHGIFDINTLQAESENPANTEFYILISVSVQTTGPDGKLFDTPQIVRNGTNWRLDGTTWVLTRFASSDPLRR